MYFKLFFECSVFTTCIVHSIWFWFVWVRLLVVIPWKLLFRRTQKILNSTQAGSLGTKEERNRNIKILTLLTQLSWLILIPSRNDTRFAYILYLFLSFTLYLMVIPKRFQICLPFHSMLFLWDLNFYEFSRYLSIF